MIRKIKYVNGKGDDNINDDNPDENDSRDDVKATRVAERYELINKVLVKATTNNKLVSLNLNRSTDF